MKNTTKQLITRLFELEHMRLNSYWQSSERKAIENAAKDLGLTDLYEQLKNE